jgi:hypothetical protein
MYQPFHIREVEWFGSTHNLCEAMKYLKQLNSPEVLKILGANTPFIDLTKDTKFKYAGFKGGSEPGVVTMTYLLQSQNNNWSCLSLAWNNESKKINSTIFQDIVKKVINLITSDAGTNSALE